MPLTAKGEEIKSALTEEYGEKRGESILYAGKNAGTFTGIDAVQGYNPRTTEEIIKSQPVLDYVPPTVRKR